MISLTTDDFTQIHSNTRGMSSNGHMPELDSFNLQPHADEFNIKPSEIHLSTTAQLSNVSVFGITFLGRAHQENGTLCQDFHLFKDLGDDWHLYIVSDGAGSAKASHRGARINCEITAHLIGQLIEKLSWKQQIELPSEVEWHMQFISICRFVRNFIEEKVEELDEVIKPKDFNATLLLLIVTPMGMLIGHIGDGRMGYKSIKGEWKSLITPHRGEEVNQTVFLMNQWDKIRTPTLKMSGVLVPETRVIKEKAVAVGLLSDGCENFTWNCMQMDPETEIYQDINTPFTPFWESIYNTLSNQNSSQEQKFSDFQQTIDMGNRSCIIEDDDRSILIGIYSDQTTNHELDTNY